MKEFPVGKLLFQCNAGKVKGIPVVDVFRYRLSEFIEMPTEENYEKTAMEMRNDLWKKKYKWNSIPTLPKNSTTFNTQHGNN